MTPAAAALSHNDVPSTALIPAPGSAPLSAPNTVELEIIPIGEDGWRVSIQGAERGNPFGLLGFVTQLGERFEVCVIGRPGAAIEAASFAEAVEVLRPAPDEVADILAGMRH